VTLGSAHGRIGRVSEELGAWVPPKEADLLDAETRGQLDDLIRRLAAEQAFSGGGDDPEAIDIETAAALPQLRAAFEQSRG
jgi:hypothetical protein